MGGILEWANDPANMGLLNLSAGLLQASGPSLKPVSFGQALGQGMQQGMQGFQQAQQAQQQQQLLDLKKTELARKANAPINVGPGGVLLDPYTKQPIFQAPFAPRAAPEIKAPTTRKVRIGKEEVTQEFNPQTMQWTEVGRGPAFSDRPMVDVKVPVNLAGNKYAETVGTKAAERDIGQHNAATAGVENLAKLDTLITHLEGSEAITGLGAEVLLNIERAKQLMMKDVASGKTVSDTELLDSLLGSDVFPMIGALGIGARGLDTPAEREFLRKVMTGTITMNKDTLVRMSKIRRDIASRAVEKWNSRVESGELDKYFEYTNTPKKKVESPSAPGQSPAPSMSAMPPASKHKGRIIVDSTGNRYKSDGMKWQKQ